MSYNSMAVLPNAVHLHRFPQRIEHTSALTHDVLRVQPYHSWQRFRLLQRERDRFALRGQPIAIDLPVIDVGT